jgi:hypothetical protein
MTQRGFYRIFWLSGHSRYSWSGWLIESFNPKEVAYGLFYKGFTRAYMKFLVFNRPRMLATLANRWCANCRLSLTRNRSVT